MVYLGHLGLLSLHVQKDTYGLCVTFPGSYVERSVACCGGGVRICFVLQQQLHQIFVTHSSSTVQRSLVILIRERALLITRTVQ